MVRSFIFDNATVKKVVVENFINDLNPTFGSLFFHQRCVCHIINLIVKDGLEHIKLHLNKIKQAINFITISRARKQDLTIYVQSMAYKKNHLSLMYHIDGTLHILCYTCVKIMINLFQCIIMVGIHIDPNIIWKIVNGLLHLS